MGLSEKLTKLEKDHIECSATVNGRMNQFDKKDIEITAILEKQSGKIDVLPWKIFGIVGGTIGVLLTICLFIFRMSMHDIQKQYENFTSKIITIEIRNMHDKIDQIHRPDKDNRPTSYPSPEPL